MSAIVPVTIDRPSSLEEFTSQFATEEACREYLGAVRWRDGFVCPRCGEPGDFWRMGDGTLRCHACRARTSVTASTIFDKTRYPLQAWFRVMWYVAGQKGDVSVHDLQHELGFSSYQTAWAWLRKLRRAMAASGLVMTGAASQGLLFYRLCESAVATPPVSVSACDLVA